jgi:hypothetical protein
MFPVDRLMSDDWPDFCDRPDSAEQDVAAENAPLWTLRFRSYDPHMRSGVFDAERVCIAPLAGARSDCQQARGLDPGSAPRSFARPAPEQDRAQPPPLRIAATDGGSPYGSFRGSGNERRKLPSLSDRYPDQSPGNHPQAVPPVSRADGRADGQLPHMLTRLRDGQPAAEDTNRRHDGIRQCRDVEEFLVMCYNSFSTFDGFLYPYWEIYARMSCAHIAHCTHSDFAL